MEYTKKQLVQLQQIEVDILEEVIRICNNNGLRYFTVGGTTLGAIRHNGFIPWDDDIDIGLLRDDYEKFLAIAPTQLGNRFLIQHYSIDELTPAYHAKVMKKGTLFLEDCVRNIKTEHGIFVDIMPFDYIPADEKGKAKYRRKILLWHQLYIAKSVRKTSLTVGKLKKICLTGIRTLLHVLLWAVPKKTIYQKLQKEITRYNPMETGSLSSRGLAVFECQETDIFPTRIHKFERLDVNIPINAEKMLTKQYGDYMQMPPIERRIGHAPYKIEF